MIFDTLKAKSKDEENYLLKDHLKETISRAIQLRDFINQNRYAFKYKFDDAFFENLIIACFLHDLGKINWKFQLKLYNEDEKEYDHENRRYKNDELDQLYEFFNDFRDIDVKDHEIISLIYSLIFLDNNDWSKKIRTAILLHHYNEFYTNKDSANIRYVFDDYPDLKKYVEFLIKKEKEIEDLLKNLHQYLLNKAPDKFTEEVLKKLSLNFERVKELKACIDNGFGLSTKLKLFNIPDREDENFYDFFVFLGCLRRCDYSASGDVKVEDIQDLVESVYKDLNEKIKAKVEKKEIWQETILAQNDSNNLVLIAPTGSGKTEFALLWAKNRGKKLIYTLPLRVALNDLYWRFSNEKEGYFKSDLLRILHSTSFIEYLKEEKDGKELDIDAKQTTAELFSSPLSLTTPDQVFLSGLKYYGFDKLVSIYPLSAIVIDEVQAYNPEMAAVIIKTLEIIKRLNGNLLIITATFPPYFEEFVSIEKGFKIIDLEKMDSEVKNKIKNYNLCRHKVELLNSQPLFEYEKQKNRNMVLKLNTQSFDKIKEILTENEPKNTLIILNNVGKAIELYKKLEENPSEFKVKKENLYLLHSRLLEKEKACRINEIKEKLKKYKERIILVATQIIEASVDVDFDMLITEISSIDSQIQRWGRAYRNRNTNYSDGVSNIFIFKDIDKGTSAIYDKEVVKKTIEILEKYQNQVLDYEKEREIIKEVFDSKVGNQTLKDVFVEEIKKNLEWLKYFSAEKRSEAQKIFRNIAGIQVVVPGLMSKSENEVERAFGEVIKDKNNWRLPWESKNGDSLINKVKEEICDESLKNKVNKWKLLQILYSCSLNLPIFSYEKHRSLTEQKDFKGFFVLRVNKNDLEDIEKYGINKKEIDIDSEEIQSNII